jgi:hypothetical protein
MMNFNGLNERQNLEALFEREAAERNADAAELEADACARQANDNAAPDPVATGGARS